MSWLDDAVVKTKEDKDLELQSANVSAAKVTRDSYITSNIIVDGFSFQVDDKGRDNMRSAIETSVRNSLPIDMTINWILSDNSVKSVTAGDLGRVLDAYSERLNTAFTAYATWRSGDKMEPFVVGE